MNRSSNFAWSLFILPLGAGIAAVAAVYLGTVFEWENFSARSGYFGTDWLGGLLYAIGDWRAIFIVGFVWFAYAFVGAFILQLPLYAMWREDKAE